MNYTMDTITHLTTGVKTMTTGYPPIRASLTVRPVAGTSYTFVRSSDGVTDGTTQICDSFTAETTRLFQRRYSDRMVCISENISGVWTEVIKITFDSFTATEFKYNVVTASSSFQLLREVEG